MIFKECLALVKDRPLKITGRLAVDGDIVTRYPILAIRAVIPQTRTAVGDTTTTRAGEFYLELGVPAPIALNLELVDANGTVLADVPVDVREPAHVAHMPVPASALTGATPIERDEREPPLLRHEAAAALRARVAALVEQEGFDRTVAEVVESALRPLAWLDTLMPDVRGVLEGRTESAERLRSALLGIGAPPLEAAPTTSLVAYDEAPLEAERADALRLIDRPGLAQLYSAIVWAVDDVHEMQAMFDGLAAALWSSPRLELLLRASTAGETREMKPLMGGPGPGLGLPSGLPGGLPPGLPGSKPKIVPVKISDKAPDLKVPINQMPSEEEKCLIGAMATVAQKKRQLPVYEIQAIDNPLACPGDVVRLTGRNFGSWGSVVFPGKGSGVFATDVLSWSDTAIRVRVPTGAAPGIIRLSIYEGTLCLCGRAWPIYRVGKTLPMFNGGIPLIVEYQVNGASSGFTAEPRAVVTVTFTSSVGPGVTVNQITRSGGTIIFNSGSLPGVPFAVVHGA